MNVVVTFANWNQYSNYIVARMGAKNRYIYLFYKVNP